MLRTRDAATGRETKSRCLLLMTGGTEADATVSLVRRSVAEFLGTGFLLAIVIGSGIMGERLSGGTEGLALLPNTLATGAGLTVLILMFGPISGAHFNPVVSLVMSLKGAQSWADTSAFVVAQTCGAVLGVWAAHAMFGVDVIQASAKLRDGAALAFSEGVATFGLLGAILAISASRPAAVPAAVGLYIASAYWFTASTSFANPAVTLARAFSDSFAGISLQSVPAFVAAQVLGAVLAWLVFGWLLQKGDNQ